MMRIERLHVLANAVRLQIDLGMMAMVEYARRTDTRVIFLCAEASPEGLLCIWREQVLWAMLPLRQVVPLI